MCVDLDLAPCGLRDGKKLLQDRGEEVADGDEAVSLTDKPCVELACCVFVGRGVRRRVGEAATRC
ncbi:hypothetical protein IMZ48_04055 [Candidatus Bathyarchaeota archaeon]|nr:hypothetical protein [Candidatus Bathyarchaeota archaeon]